MCIYYAVDGPAEPRRESQEWLNLAEAPRSVATNNQLAVTANRFNYVFNLKARWLSRRGA